jgi:(1->4)-alpha-D-glucan 1-alpha-D-glucosylmutase
LHFADVVHHPSARLPLATYRLQFNRRFTFGDARDIVDYLHALGITDAYASSYLRAVPGSPHGYDVADPTRLNPEIGSDAEYDAWIDALHARGMGHVLDLVPNHMGIAKSANPWWLDVLENGPSSRFAHVFDIDWQPVKAELHDKVLIPILGDQYGEVLERQELTLAIDDGAFAVRYYDNTLPIAPDTYPLIFSADLDAWLAARRDEPKRADADELQSILTSAVNLPPRSTRDAEAMATRAREKDVVKRRLAALAARSADVADLVETCLRRFNGRRGDPHSFDPLDQLLNEQSYRLAHWRVASEEINYRRFFDVNELAAVRMEDPDVFDAVHRFVLDLVHRGAATGLRIDHVDGLYAPGDYLRRLQARCAEATGGDGSAPFFVIVEKILGGNEQLPGEWPVAGTTGYEFAAMVNNLFVDRRNERALDDIYLRFIHERRARTSFADLAYRSKKQVMHETMSGDINALGHQLNLFSERNRHFRDFTLYSLIATLKDVIACFPVYRTYVQPDAPVTDHDRRYITAALRCARQRTPGVPSVIFDFIGRLLLKQTMARTPEECDARARFVGKFQQITSPVAAKGIEDTALYVYNRLVSLNEVGADPQTFGVEPAAVHDWMAARQARWPAALSATATHDTKRGEDVRARLNVLSELPGAWKGAVAKWRAVNRRFKMDVEGRLAPDANEEYLLYQTLVGAWPFETGPEQAARFAARIVEYMTKALREAKVHTSWLSPDLPYEDAVTRFIEAILDRRRPNLFLQTFQPFQARIAELGIYNSLAQLLIKITAPGIPDFYQGTELWDLNLVDPDNRRPVDYGQRKQLLADLEPFASASRATATHATAAPGNADPTPEAIAALLGARQDGRIKLFAMARALGARARMRRVFEQGDYIPLSISGARRDCLFAFARRHSDGVALTCVPRLVATLIPDAAAPPIGSSVWGDTRVELPPGLPQSFREALTGASIDSSRIADEASIPAAAIFERLPVALLLPR